MYDFDEIIDRRHTNALNTDGFRDYIFHADDSMTFPYKDEEFIRMWVADMEFATPDVVIDGIRRRLDRRIFGYTRVFEDAYYQAFAAWCRRRYGWDFPREQLVMSNGIIPALYELVEYISAPDEQVLFLTPSYAYFKYAATWSGPRTAATPWILTIWSERPRTPGPRCSSSAIPTTPPAGSGGGRSWSGSPPSRSGTACG